MLAKVIDSIFIFAYLALMAFIGIIAYRKNKTSEDFFVAGKSLGTFSIAVLWFGGEIGGASIIAASTNVYNYGISGIWYIIIIAFACTVFAVMLTKKVKSVGDRLGVITYPSLICERYGRKPSDIAVICAFIANLGFLASQFVAMTSMLVTITGWSMPISFIISTIVTVFYSSLGGYRAVTYTTWFQAVLILLGTVILGFPIVAVNIGGIEQVKVLPVEWFDWGRSGWPTILALAVSTTLSYQTGMSHYTSCFSAKDGKSAKKGVLWAAVSVLFIAFSVAFIGLGARILMPNLSPDVSPYVAIIKELFPMGLSGLVIVGVFAAVMSTADVSINCCAANISVDFYKNIVNPKASDKKVMRLGILSSFVVSAIAALMAWWKQNIIELLLLAYTFQAATLFIPTICGLFWRKPTQKAAFYSMLVSLAVVLVWLVGDGLKLGSVFKIDALWPGLITSALTFIVLVFAIKPSGDDERRVKRFFSDKMI